MVRWVVVINKFTKKHTFFRINKPGGRGYLVKKKGKSGDGTKPVNWNWGKLNFGKTGLRKMTIREIGIRGD